MIGSMLEHARPLIVESGLLELGFQANSFEFKTLNAPETLSELTSLARTHFGAETVVRLKTMNGEGESLPLSLAEKKSREEAERVRSLEEAARTHPAVQAALEVFGGTIGKIEELKE